MKNPRLEYDIDADGNFIWRLKAANGEIIGTPHEGFTQKHNAKENLQAVRDALNNPELEVVDLTIADDTE